MVNNKYTDDIVIKTCDQLDNKNDDFIRDKLHQFNIEKIGQDIQYSAYAYDDSKITGGILVSAEKTSIFIEILWVDDAYRDKGIGTRLLVAAEQEAIRRNIQNATTDTFEFQAVNFYLKNGYSEIGRIPKYIEGYDKVFFRKKLNIEPLVDVINTERLILRKMSIADLARLTEISTNPIVMASFPPELKTPERSKIVLDKIIKQQVDKGYSLYAVIHKEDNKLIGFCGFLDNESDAGDKFIELGYRLDNAYWGKGLATEAALACRDYAFNQLKFNEFCSIILEDNYASLAVANKVGMKKTNIIKYHGNDCLLFKLKNNDQ